MLLRCYAEGRPGAWEAICLDFDVAVQGPSFEAVDKDLREAIGLYLEEIADYPAKDRARLLNRKAPLLMRLKYLWCMIRSGNDGDNNTPKERHEFTFPASAPA